MPYLNTGWCCVDVGDEAASGGFGEMLANDVKAVSLLNVFIDSQIYSASLESAFFRKTFSTLNGNRS
jgi:hypothetical protein